MAKNKSMLTIQNFHQMASLVSVKLSSTNFLLWKSQIFPLIRSAQLMHHLEEEAPAMKITKDGEQVPNPNHDVWLNNDGLLTSWLLGTMNEEALSLVVGCDTAFQIWKCLEEHYLASTKEQELHLKGQLATKRGDNESLEDFIRKFRGTCDRLAAIRKPLDDLDKVFQLSRVVGIRYQPYNLAVLSKAPYPTFNQYTAGLLNNERDIQATEQESKNKTPTFAQVFVAQRGRGNRGRGYGGRNFNSHGRGFVQAGNYNHNWTNNSRNNLTNHNPAPQEAIHKKFQQKYTTHKGENPCQICGITGHTALKCWYRFDHAYQSEELPQALAALTMMEDKDPNVYIDSGATNHMTADPGKLYIKRPYHGNQRVFTGDGTPLQISHTGNSSIGPLKLNDILVVPNLKKNLISVSKFTDDNPCIFELSSNGCVIKDQVTQAVLAKGTRKGQLYALEEGEKFALAAISNKATDSIWHQRLGHPNSNVLKTLASKNNIVVSKWDKSPFLCSGCQMGKICKLSFKRNNERATSLFQKVHCDLWGPSPVQSTHQFVYYAIFVDDYSRYTWFYPLHKKSDFFGVFQKFQKMIVNQFDKNIQVFQSDGGGEFSSKAFVNYLAECGIKQQVSCPGNPEQNGTAERKHKHIVETGLTMLLHANMPPRYWVEGFSTAVFLINRMPTPILKNKSPYFILYGKVPNYSMIKVFGCRCFPYLKDYAANKLQPRSLPCVFIGYSPIHKGYKCLHPPTQRVYISRHVVFDENFLPYFNLSCLSSNVSTGGELCKYPDCDDWTRAPSNLQPSRKVDELTSAPASEQHINEDNTVVSTNTRVITINEDNSWAEHNDMHSRQGMPVAIQIQEEFESPPSTINAQENEVASSSLPNASEEGANPSQPSLVSESSYSHHGGVLPPPHNATSTSVHPMVTRAKSRKHTGHVQTVFQKSVHNMTTNNSVLNSAGLNVQEPKTVKQALKLPHWVDAMKEELEALHNNNTWTLVPSPSPQTNIVGSKWVFKTKLHSDGSIDRFKARLVARGYSQVPGLDFDETFSPVLKPTTLRLVIALATTLSWPLRQLDVKNAFLHGKLKEEVYMSQPPGFEDPIHPNYVCKLNKSIYGLKQAPRAWFDTFTIQLFQIGFYCSRADSSLFILHRVNKFLGGVFLSQAKYAKDILCRASMLEASAIATPMAIKDATSLRDNELVNAQEYRKLEPTLTHLRQVKRILRYIKGTMHHGLRFSSHSTLSLTGFCDADWAGCLSTRRSTTGYCVFLEANCISWSSKKQPTVARSTAEAEYRALASTTAEFQVLKFKLGLVGSPTSSLRGSMKEQSRSELNKETAAKEEGNYLS
ncbi:hypothetical protein SLEP1_g6653 [Rubroshorea leprosula]|uniref:Integrase catalytic domain-containing protein n=1 Tax=Rubroshorea leprosula TaxID=152421 RepID=A0AAV5I4U9_9ROSI|nr:hypothetical protein SLEP1_g6653 [Rubroshorea leprosula]